MSDLVAFLAARLDEELYEAIKFSGDPDWSPEIMASLFQRNPSDPIIRHIAHYDPSRVLRDVAANREILYRCAARMDELDVYPNGLVSPRAVLARQILMNLAAVYSGHPDYDPAWGG